MLTVNVPLEESFDDSKQEFVVTKSFTLELEHSLASLSKWESFYEKPFLTDEEKTPEETLHYLKCMILTENYPENIFDSFKEETYAKINEYVNANMTATWFNEKENGPVTPGHKEIITSELIYYWMVGLQIPFECQYWHLNRLITLVKVCNLKNQPEKKMTRSEAMQRHRELNAQRRRGGVG